MSCFATREPSIAALKAAPVMFRFGSNKRRVLVDAITAGAILAVHAVVNADNQAKIERMIANPAGLSKVASFAISKCKVGG